jgi:hypothetical protein
MYVQAREGETFEERFRPAHEERRDKIRNAARKKRRATAKTGGRG